MTICLLNKIHETKKTWMIEVVKSYQSDGYQIISRNKYKFKSKEDCIYNLPLIHKYEKGLEYNVIYAELHIDKTGWQMGYKCLALFNYRADEVENL